MSITSEVKERALDLGFVAVGVAPAQRIEFHERALLDRLAAGRMNGLSYFTPQRATSAADPRALFPAARSVVALALPVDNSQPSRPPARHGLVARYARGSDYHRLARERLTVLADFIRDRTGAASRVFADATPLLERAFAARAGLGWFGKSNMLIVRGVGTLAMLAEVVTEADLVPDEPALGDCGACDACIRACPTGALRGPYDHQAGLCLAFLTTELRGPLPRQLRSRLGPRLLGCDSCQDVCPRNDGVTRSDAAPAGVGLPAWLHLPGLLSLDERGFATRFAGTAATRAKRAGLFRNAAVVLGNAGDRDAVEALGPALSDPEPLVRGHAAWALGRLGGSRARRALEKRMVVEDDPFVVAEIESARAGVS